MKVLSGVYPAGTYDGTIRYRGPGPPVHRRSPTAKTSASSSSTRSWRWCRCCPLPRTSSLARKQRSTASSTGSRPSHTRKLLDKVGLKEHPQHADHQYRHRQAAAGRNRQGAEQEGEAAHPRRADLLPQRDGLRSAAGPAARFKAQGISSILITHKLNEVVEVADRITVIRDGKTVDTLDIKDGTVDEDRIIKAMVGRDADGPLSAARSPNRRHRVRSEELERLSPAACRPADDQGRGPQCPRRARWSALPG